MSFKPIILFLALLALPGILSGQTPDSLWLNDDWYYTTESGSFFDLTRYLPGFLRDEAYLKRYIRDERFFRLRRQYDDTLAVDAVFDRAMLIAEGDVRRALLLSTAATMDHRRLGIRLPLLGTVFFPLTFENDSLFRIRRTHLPKRVLADRPRAVDKDKLQHFFGSAYIAYLFNSDRIAKWAGDRLEDGEESFVAGGREDERDKAANAKGREFGLRLLREPDLLPSDVLWGREP